MIVDRRTLIAAVALLALPGCATIGDLGLGVEPAIRRLLTLSSQRAFERLLTDNGFFEDEVARVDLPDELGGSAGGRIAGALLRSPTVQRRLLRAVNAAAAEGAERAAPLVYDTIRDMTISDALAIARGGPSAATDYLERELGARLFDALLPGVSGALRLAEDDVVGTVLREASGIDIAGLSRDVARKASAGIYRAIGREEAAIRADPRATNDPSLIAVFGLG